MNIIKINLDSLRELRTLFLEDKNWNKNIIFILQYIKNNKENIIDKKVIKFLSKIIIKYLISLIFNYLRL